MKYLFKALDATHRSLVHQWLKEPHVAEWWYGQGLENTLRHIDEFLHGPTPFHYWLAYDQERPFAFLITTSIRKPQDELARWCSPKGEAITLDLLIGDKEYLGKGIAANVIQEFLTQQAPQVSEVLIDPEATNTRAIHVYEKAGFKKIAEFIPAHSPHLHYLMKLIQC